MLRNSAQELKCSRHGIAFLSRRGSDRPSFARTQFDSQFNSNSGSEDHKETCRNFVPSDENSRAVKTISSDFDTSLKVLTRSVEFKLALSEYETFAADKSSLSKNSYDLCVNMPSDSLTMNFFSTRRSSDGINADCNFSSREKSMTTLFRAKYNNTSTTTTNPRLDGIEQDLDTLERDFREVVQKQNSMKSSRSIVKKRTNGVLDEKQREQDNPVHMPEDATCDLDIDEVSEFISLFDEPSDRQATELEVRIISPESNKRKKCILDSRYREFMKYKDDLRNYGVPQEYHFNPALGRKCSTMRKNCCGPKPPNVRQTSRKSHQGPLKQVGFNFHIGGNNYSSLMFDRRCQELVEFKRKFGHCDHVPHEENPDLHKWCIQIRSALRQHAKGKKTRYHLTAERVFRLETIGFRWRDDANALTFDKRCRELIDYKKAFGHCDVPKRYKSNPSLGRWCGNLRTAYNKLQQGGKSTYNLTKERIERLEKIGFNWKVK